MSTASVNLNTSPCPVNGWAKGGAGHKEQEQGHHKSRQQAREPRSPSEKVLSLTWDPTAAAASFPDVEGVDESDVDLRDDLDAVGVARREVAWLRTCSLPLASGCFVATLDSAAESRATSSPKRLTSDSAPWATFLHNQKNTRSHAAQQMHGGSPFVRVVPNIWVYGSVWMHSIKGFLPKNRSTNSGTKNCDYMASLGLEMRWHWLEMMWWTVLMPLPLFLVEAAEGSMNVVTNATRSCQGVRKRSTAKQMKTEKDKP